MDPGGGRADPGSERVGDGTVERLARVTGQDEGRATDALQAVGRQAAHGDVGERPGAGPGDGLALALMEAIPGAAAAHAVDEQLGGRLGTAAREGVGDLLTDGGHPLAHRWRRDRQEGRLPGDDPVDALGVVDRRLDSDDAAEAVANERRPHDAERVEHGDHVGDVAGDRDGRGVGHHAGSAAAPVDEHDTRVTRQALGERHELVRRGQRRVEQHHRRCQRRSKLSDRQRLSVVGGHGGPVPRLVNEATQIGPRDLAESVPGQLPGANEPGRHLEPGETVPGEVAEIVVAHDDVRRGHDDGDRDLPPRRIGDADDGDLADARERGQDRLDLAGRHILAAADDQVVAPPVDHEPTAAIEPTEVPRVEPAVGGEGRVRRLGVIEVTGEDHRPTQMDLAVAEPQLDAGERLADGVGAVGKLVEPQRDHPGSRLGQAVGRDDRPARCDRASHEHLRDRASAEDDGAQAVGGRGRVRRLEDRRELGGHEGGVADDRAVAARHRQGVQEAGGISS